MLRVWKNCGLVFIPLFQLVVAVLLLSTPNGVGNWFHKTYTEAEEEKNDFHTINYPGKYIPDRDDNGLKKRQEICLAEK